ncbi:MAG: tetratricopeptide repeat protein [Cyanobacteria bacterium P01_F01_bin.42]
MSTFTSSLKRSLFLSALVGGALLQSTMPAAASVTASDFDSAIAIDSVTDTVADAADKTADDYYDRGIYYQGQNQIDTALDQFTQAIALNPYNPDYYFSRGLTHSDNGDLSAAQSDFSRAIELDPAFAAAYYQRGLARIILPVSRVTNLAQPELAPEQRSKFQLAVQDFSQALEHSPDFIAAHYYRGLSHYVMGNESLATQDYQQARQLNPLIAESFYREGFTQLYTGGPQRGQL